MPRRRGQVTNESWTLGKKSQKYNVSEKLKKNTLPCQPLLPSRLAMRTKDKKASGSCFFLFAHLANRSWGRRGADALAATLLMDLVLDIVLICPAALVVPISGSTVANQFDCQGKYYLRRRLSGWLHSWTPSSEGMPRGICRRGDLFGDCGPTRKPWSCWTGHGVGLECRHYRGG